MTINISNVKEILNNKVGQVKGVAVSGSRLVFARDGREDIFQRRGPVEVDEYYADGQFKTPEEMLEKMGIVVFPEDNVDFFPDPKLGLGSKITVRRAAEVEVNDTGKIQTYHTWGKAVGDFLEEKMVYLGLNDTLYPSKDTLIENKMVIDIERAADTTEIEHFYTPFNVIVQDDSWLADGKVRIKQQGIRGDRQLVWEVVRRGNEEIKRTLLEDKIAQVVQDKIVQRGTKPVTFQGPYYDWIKEAAAKYGVDPDQMYRVMMCESGGYPYAYNDSGPYYGLFQYDRLTWSASGWGDHDINDPYAQINAAAKAWASRYTKWPVTSRVCGDLGR